MLARTSRPLLLFSLAWACGPSGSSGAPVPPTAPPPAAVSAPAPAVPAAGGSAALAESGPNEPFCQLARELPYSEGPHCIVGSTVPAVGQPITPPDLRHLQIPPNNERARVAVDLRGAFLPAGEAGRLVVLERWQSGSNGSHTALLLRRSEGEWVVANHLGPLPATSCAALPRRASEAHERIACIVHNRWQSGANDALVVLDPLAPPTPDADGRPFPTLTALVTRDEETTYRLFSCPSFSLLPFYPSLASLTTRPNEVRLGVYRTARDADDARFACATYQHPPANSSLAQEMTKRAGSEFVELVFHEDEGRFHLTQGGEHKARFEALGLRFPTH